MEIYLAIDRQELDKFKTVANSLENSIERNKLATVKNYQEYTNEHNSICMVFSNRIKYLQEIAKKTSCEIINVTENLSGGYILEALKHAKDIYYLKLDETTLIDRLTSRVRFIKDNTKRK